MTATRQPAGSRTPPGIRSSASPARLAVRVVLGIGLVVGALVFASLSSSLLNVGLLVAFALVTAGGLLLKDRPELLLPIAVYTMWLEGLGFGPIRMGRIIVVLALGVMASRILTSSWRPPAVAARVWLPIMAVCIWAWSSALWSRTTGAWFNGFFALFLAFTYAALFAFFVTDPDHLLRLMKGWVAIGSLIGVASCVVHYGFGYRSFGLTGGPNEYALLNVAGIPIALTLFRRTEGRERYLYIAAILLLIGGTFSAGSRGGLVGTCAISLYCAVTWPGLAPRVRLRAILVAPVVVGVIMGAAIISDPERFSPLAFMSDRGAGRLDIWAAGVEAFKEHWLLGYGAGGFEKQAGALLQKVTGGNLDVANDPNFRDNNAIPAHNLYLAAVLDLGVIGFVLYWGAYAAAMKNLWDMRRTRWKDLSWFGLGILSTYLVTAMFSSGLNQKMMWVLMGLPGAYFVHRYYTPRDQRRDEHLALGSGAAALVPADPAGQTSRTLVRRPGGRAAMDLRLPWRLGRSYLVAAVLGALIVGGGTSLLAPSRYEGRLNLFVVKLDDIVAKRGVEIAESRAQAITALARSEPYLVELRRQSGVDLSLDELSRMVDADRPRLAAIAQIRVIGSSRSDVEALTAHLGTTMDVMIDRIRQGSLEFLDEDGRDPFAGQAASWRGPLYLQLFDRRSFAGPVDQVVEYTPRTTNYALVGAGLGVMMLASVGLLAHERHRVTSREDLDQIFGLPQLASLPRPVRGRHPRLTQYVTGMAASLAPLDPGRRVTIGIVGHGTLGLRRRLAFGLGAALGGVTGDVTTVIDLSELPDRPRRWGRPRAGFFDVATRGLPPSAVLERLPRRRVPRWARQLGRLTPLRLVRSGGCPPESVIDDAAVGEALGMLAADSHLVVLLPSIPGPVPVRAALGQLDELVVVLLDGWTSVDDTEIIVDAARAGCRGRASLLLLQS